MLRLTACSGDNEPNQYAGEVLQQLRWAIELVYFETETLATTTAIQTRTLWLFADDYYGYYGRLSDHGMAL